MFRFLLKVGILLFLTLVIPNLGLSTSLIPMQLQGVDRVSLVFTLDKRLDINEDRLKTTITDILEKSGVKANGSRQALSIVAKIDKVPEYETTVAFYVAVRFEDEVKLVRNPNIPLRNCPTIIWQDELLRIVSSENVTERAQRAIIESVASFADNVRLATQLAREPSSSK